MYITLHYVHYITLHYVHYITYITLCTLHYITYITLRTLHYITYITLHYITLHSYISWLLGRMLLWYQIKYPIRASHCLIFIQSLFLPIFSKILERVVFDQVVNYFTTHNLFWTINLAFVMDMLPIGNMCCTLVSK